MKRHILLMNILVLFGIGQVFAQLVITPEKPKPGDVINFTYTPSAKVFNANDTIKCLAYKWGIYEDDFVFENDQKYKEVDVKLVKNGNNYAGSIATDKLTRAVTFNFTSGKVKWKRVERNQVMVGGKVDANDNAGYCVFFYNPDGRECRYSNYFLGYYLAYQFYNNIGIANPQKSVAYLLRETELYPESTLIAMSIIASVMPESDPEGFKALATSELNRAFDKGLQTEDDYMEAAILTYSLKLKGMSKYFDDLSEEKFKDSEKATMNAFYEKFKAENNVAEKEKYLNSMVDLFYKLNYDQKVKLVYTPFQPGSLKNQFLSFCIEKDMLETYQSYQKKFSISKENKPYDYYTYKEQFDSLLAHNKYPEYTEKQALEYLAFYTDRYNAIVNGKFVSGIVDDEYLSKDSKKERAINAVILFSDFCASLYQKDLKYKQALGYAKDAVSYMKMLRSDYYSAPEICYRYSVIAEKALPARECKAEVEKLVAAGSWKPEMIEILKRIYVKEKKTAAGFDEYIIALKKSQMDEIKKSLAATMLNEPAPAFSLSDLDGKTVSLADFKGKTVILDFWATWCGPCKASFPGMRKLQEFYQNNPNVKILFIDTWERFPTEQEKHDKVKQFITEKNYPFHVLMDNKSKVVSDFKISGIPTKCIIDKNGNLRYKIVGAETNEGKLLDEMNAMIESIK
jgi:thiol-disulfide isomerase/thioredoxin